MRIGILSDTHDCLEMVDTAVKQLNGERVDLVLHAGDYVSPFVIPRLANLQSPMIGVLGNNDGDHHLLSARFAEYVPAGSPRVRGHIRASSSATGCH